MPRVWPARANCVRVWISTGKRLRKNAEVPRYLAVDDPRLSVDLESHAGSALPFLSELLLLHAHCDRTLRSRARNVARASPAAALSPLQQGWLRPCAGRENDQCLIPACCCGSRWRRFCSTTTRRGCTITRRPATRPRLSPPQVPPRPAASSAIRCP